MRIKSHMILPAVMMIVALFAVVTAALRVWQVANWNSELRETFEEISGGVSTYEVERGTSPDYLEQFGITEATPLNSTFGAGVSEPLTVTLEKPLKYYDAPNGSVVLTLEPGEYLTPAHFGDATNCYGYRSFPTEAKGWRYARPFVAADGELGEGLFVRTDELYDVLESIAADSDNLETVALYTDESGDVPVFVVTKEVTSAEFYFFRNDAMLYDSHFCSPDLEAPLFDTRTAFTGIAGILLVGWSIVVFIVRNREENARVAAEQAEQDRAHAEAKAKHDEWMRTRAEKNRAKGRKKR